MGGRKYPKPKHRKISQRKFLKGIAGAFLRAAKRVGRRVAFLAGVCSVVGVGFPLYQAFFVLVPAVQPDAAISASWLDLPITVGNSSMFLDFKNARFFCRMTEQQFESTGETKKVLIDDFYRVAGLVEWPLREAPSVIPASQAISFPCDIAKNSTLSFDGIPLPMKLIHLSIRTQYDINLGLFQWHRQSTSQTFTWQQVSGGWQWLPGETSPGPK